MTGGFYDTRYINIKHTNAVAMSMQSSLSSSLIRSAIYHLCTARLTKTKHSLTGLPISITWTVFIGILTTSRFRVLNEA